MEPIIKVENISKKYQIRHQKQGMAYSSLRDDMVTMLKRPLQFFGGKQGDAEDFWALKDINFTVNPGEILGIIGPNGAGKSTLLKVLTRITPPSEGKISLRGRVSSLLEVGTGFHPELSGRENIYLNGAILGMTKKEIDAKFNEIVEFAGVEKFLDTPAKRYSSGMYVRLAFSVAAHLEPDILLVDEVLAVGDAVFQKKSLGKMQEVTGKKDRTILFVSHNMGIISNLCERAILMDKGKIVKIGKSQEVIDYYLNSGIRAKAVSEYPKDASKKMQIRKIQILDANLTPSVELDLCQSFSIEITYDVNEPVKQGLLEASIFSMDGSLVLLSVDSEKEEDYQKLYLQKREVGTYVTRLSFPKSMFNMGTYRFRFLASSIHEKTHYDTLDNISISFYDSGNFHQKYQIDRGGLTTIPIPWETKKVN